jgi:hypothetical protein
VPAAAPRRRHRRRRLPDFPGAGRRAAVVTSAGRGVADDAAAHDGPRSPARKGWT